MWQEGGSTLIPALDMLNTDSQRTNTEWEGVAGAPILLRATKAIRAGTPLIYPTANGAEALPAAVRGVSFAPGSVTS